MNYDPTRILYTGLQEPPKVGGASIYHLPALEFRTLLYSISDLVTALEMADGVCLYSVRAIDSIRSEPRVLGALLDRKPQLVVVGEKTAAAWEQHIDPRCEPTVCRRFDELVAELKLRPDLERVVALELQDGPRSLLRVKTRQAVDAFEVYATSKNIPDAKTWGDVERFGPEWIAFTSPRGVRSFASNIRDMDLDYRIASIGPTTTSAVKRAGMTVSAEAKSPSAERLIEIILREST